MVVAREEDEQQKGEHIGEDEEEVRVIAGHTEGEAELVAAGFGETEEKAGAEGGHDFPVTENEGGDGEVTIAHVD